MKMVSKTDLRKRRYLVAVLVFITGCLLLTGIQGMFRSSATDGIYFYDWSTEDLMQTVSLVDLKADPISSLSNIHMQPPLLDTIRTLLAGLFHDVAPGQLLRKVDSGIFLIWTGFYGFLGALLYLWFQERMTTSFAVGLAVLFLLHPATLLYVTVSDTTFLSTVLISLLMYQLWRLKEQPQGSVVPFACTAVLLFFTRSVFQWPALVLFLISLWLLKVPKRSLAVYSLIGALFVVPYLAKQYAKFGILSTSSLTGINLLNSISGTEIPGFWRYDLSSNRNMLRGQTPAVLSREKKLTGTPNFNHSAYLELDKKLLGQYREKLRQMTIFELCHTWLDNLLIYMKPSSSFDDTAITEALPWKGLYDRLFSSYVLAALVVSAAVSFLVPVTSGSLRQYLGLGLPVIFIFLVSVLCEKGDNMRFKFFIEPVLYTLIVLGGCRLVKRFRPGRTAT